MRPSSSAAWCAPPPPMAMLLLPAQSSTTLSSSCGAGSQEPRGKATDSARSKVIPSSMSARTTRPKRHYIHTCGGNARRLATPDFCPRTRSALLLACRCSSFAASRSSSAPANCSHPRFLAAAFSGVCGAVDEAARSDAAAAAACCRDDACGLRLILMDGKGRVEKGE